MLVRKAFQPSAILDFPYVAIMTFVKKDAL